MTVVRQKCPASRPKCPLLIAALKNGKKWLFYDTYVFQPGDREAFENCVSVLEYHLTDCGCISTSKVNIFLGICHLQKFNSNSLNFMDNAESLHLKIKCEEAKKIEQDEKKQPQPLNDVAKEYTNCSKFKWKYDNSASVKNFKTLILSALKALEQFCLSHENGDNTFDLPSLEQVNFFSHLNSLFQIFYFYNMFHECHRVVDLSLALCDSFIKKIPLSKMSETMKTVPCNAIKLFLRISALDTVKSIFFKFFTKKEIEDIPLNSFQNCELFLLYIEFAIRLRTVSSLIPKFKQFMKSEYIEKRTVRRYLSKSLAFVTATRFNSTHYSFSPTFEEFTESYVMISELLKKFSRSERFKHSVEQWEPLSLRYACFNLFIETSRLTIDFFVNTGMYSDAAYYYNATCNFFHRTLNIFELSNLQLKVSQNDLANGFTNDSINKLNSIENSYVWGEETREMFQPCNANDQAEKIIQEDDILGKLDRLTLEDKARNVFHEVRKSNKLADTIDDFFGNERSLIDLINDNMEVFASGRMYQELFFFVLRYTYHRIVLQAKQSENHSICFHKQLSNLLDLMEIYARKQYLQRIKEQKSFSSHEINTKFDFQINYMQIGETFFLFAVEYAQALINETLYEKAFSFLNKAVLISNNDYCLRVRRCELFYLHAYAGYKLAKASYPNAPKILTLCYDDQRKSFSIPKDVSSRDCGTYDSPIGKKNKAINIVNKNNCIPPPKRQDRMLTRQAEAEIIRHTMPKLVLDISDPIETYQEKDIFDETVIADDDDDDEEEELSESSDDLLRKCLIEYSKMVQICSDDCFFIRNLKKEEKVIVDEIFEKVLRLLMSKILNYVGSHPPMVLFEKSHFLSYKIAKMVGKANSNLLFHLSHVTKTVSLRYRMLLISSKKRKYQLDVEEDIQRFKFVSSDYCPEAFWTSMPTNWRFVQFIYVEHSREPYLLIVRFQAKRSPLLIKIKSRLQPQSFFNNLIKEFQDIMTGNSLSFAEVIPKSFWDMRYALDNRLGDLLLSFEKITTIVFKAMFLGVLECQKYQTARQYFITRIRQQAGQFEIANYDQNLLELFTDSILFLSKAEFAEGIQIIFGDCDEKFLKICFQYCDKAFSHWTTRNSLEMLFKQVNPVGLIPCNQLLNFPIESLPTGKKMYQPYFRIPSLKFAALLYEKFKSTIDNVPQRTVYYLLNPQNNLGKTEAVFKERFQGLEGWNGVTGKEPDFEELKKHLLSDDIYIYVGHGSGQSYYNCVGLDTFKLNPISMVFGCSSAKVIEYGKLAEVYGVQFKFLLHGAPCYVGSMWDITDKDIDAFTDDFFSGWFVKYDSNRKDKCPQMNRKISTSRDVCRLKNLVGGAPVIYGLPISAAITES